ncbi:hypothetical protein T440DRAFT_470172 [Plenodomus tracheiphilus IPT5]|uniref:Rhodopsin domain-containing protein n=1 Tax=Plenodomus tracheiphilus IPT5 TaxID=1408161 RepID=A0A6A7AZ54_9PLEO|nr:hypothetical protein T440DRAFT_470172 [Plenodomus tracheiphilus IPT5]
MVMLLLKISIFIDWIHVFVPPQVVRGGFYYACVGNMVMNIIFYVACLFVEIFACTPREKIWNFFVRGTCVNVYLINVASSVFNFVLDVVMLGMPQYKIWRLQLSKKRKVAISLLFKEEVAFVED